MDRLLLASFFAGLFVFCLGACVPMSDEELAQRREERYSVCEFQPGNMVRSKVSGEVGQVISMRLAYVEHRLANWCYADVRFQGSQMFTDSRVLSDDGPVTIRALQIVEGMQPYELEHVE